MERTGLVRAFESVVGAVLVDPSRLPALRPRRGYRPVPELGEVTQVLDVLLELYEDIDAVIDVSAVLNALGDCPARRRVVPLHRAACEATNAQQLFEESLEKLGGYDRKLSSARLMQQIQALEARIRGGDSDAERELEIRIAELQEINRGPEVGVAEAAAVGTETTNPSPATESGL